ncbi:phenylalanine ammonia-lyase, partial [bacterium]|nr:phenylalanine ammonia-lyase [candidate division CSSED10-310 bacterium]
LDFRDFQFGRGVTKAKEIVRKHIDFLDVDRPLYPDHTTMKSVVRSSEILEAVEEEIGTLG